MNNEFDKYYIIGAFMNEYVYYNPAQQLYKLGNSNPFPFDEFFKHVDVREPKLILAEIKRINKMAGLD